MRDQGLVNQVFDEQKLRALQGDMAVGHVRYSHDRRELVGELPAGLSRRPPRGRARPQRQPRQRGRAAPGAAREGRHLPLHVRLRDHRRARLHARGGDGRGRAGGRHRPRRGRLQHGRDDRGPRRRLPRSARPAPALDRHARRPLLRGVGDLRVRHHRRPVPARRPAGRDRLDHRQGHPDAPGGAVAALRAVRLRAHLLRAPRLPPRRPGHPGLAREDGRDPGQGSAGATPTW